MSLAELEQQASPAAVEFAARVLRADIAERAWIAQVGFSLTGAQAAELLRRSEQAISKDNRLLRLPRSDGRPAYPAFQFDGRRQLPGIADVVRALVGPLGPAAVAAWLTGPNPRLADRRPLDVLMAGDRDSVVHLARRLASRADH